MCLYTVVVFVVKTIARRRLANVHEGQFLSYSSLVLVGFNILINYFIVIVEWCVDWIHH